LGRAILAGFLGMSLAAAEDENIRPQIFDAVFPIKLNAAVNRFADFLSCLVYAFLTFLAVKFVASSYANSEIAAVLDWPLWPIQLILPYAFFTVSVRYVIFAFSPSLKASFLSQLAKAAYA
jgi:TRAP-type C4-dicarboxylate transport system permease small subunit